MERKERAQLKTLSFNYDSVVSVNREASFALVATTTVSLQFKSLLASERTVP